MTRLTSPPLALWTSAPDLHDNHHLVREGLTLGAVKRCCCVWVAEVIEPDTGYGRQVGESCDPDDAKAMVERELGL